MMRLVAAALALFIAPAALAQTHATLDTRNATVHLDYGGGFATAHKAGSADSMDPVGLDGPALVSIAGADQFVGDYLAWSVWWNMDWQIQQAWSINPRTRALTGSGHTQLNQTHGIDGLGCPNCAASVAMTAHNWQDLQFTLDAPASFGFHSEVSLNQGVQINRWDEGRQRWSPFIGSTAGGVTDRTGTFAAGRWQVVSSRVIENISSGTPSLDESWSFSLTMPDVAWSLRAVPEPSAAWLLAGGLGLLAWRRRHKSLEA